MVCSICGTCITFGNFWRMKVLGDDSKVFFFFFPCFSNFDKSQVLKTLFIRQNKQKYYFGYEISRKRKQNHFNYSRADIEV